MIAVITGDMVASRKMPDKRLWLQRLKEIIERKSGLPKTPRWTIYRGDGFQIELPRPTDALRIALLIRSGLRSVPQFDALKLDARMGIGIGAKGYKGRTIAEADGEAFQLSGAVLDGLQSKGQKLEIRSPFADFDKSVNVSLSLASVIIDDWTQASAELVWTSLSSSLTQKKMSKLLKISQPAVHKRYASSHLKELTELLRYYEEQLNKLSPP